MDTKQAKVAFMILSDDPARAIPGLVMAKRLKEHRGDDVRVLFFGPGVKLAASGDVDTQIQELRAVDILPKACGANVEAYGIAEPMSQKPIELLSAGQEVEEFHHQGYTVLTF